MMDISSMRAGRDRVGRRVRIAALLLAPVLFGGCSLPDWADPFGNDYGPVPQPVTRAGAATAIPPAPDAGLAADTTNVRHSEVRQVAAVTQDSAAEAAEIRAAAAARPEIAVTRIETPAATTQVRPPQVAAPRAEAAQPAAPVTVMPAVTAQETRATRVAVAPAPSAGASSRTADDDEIRNSPTPMIAAMTRGQQPPSFSRDGSVVARRTSVQPSSSISPGDPQTPVTDTASRDPGNDTIISSEPATAIASHSDVRPGTSSTAALATTAPALTAPQPQTTLDRTYRDQLRAAGIDPVTGQGAGGSAAVAPGQFPSSVSPVVQQTYLQSLNAPQTYEQAVGLAPRSSGSTAVITGGYGGSGAGSSGPVVISGDGVYQPATARSFAGRSGAAATILFANNSARLSASDDAVIRQLAANALRQNATVRVVGHASSRTREQAVGAHLLVNLRISADRANAVADRMAAFGVPYERIIVEARGDNEPVYNEAMPSGESGNRRAEIFLE
ncbi:MULTISPECIES: OmpA family protein [unclassified Minwuia]|uniref:OmpA family protein n=1 Tax=unclassified Minwuia TaxID=2618799 RepID=UPI00247AF200|nr:MULTISPECIES: OmpA family protein [unclassified Minwuia]